MYSLVFSLVNTKSIGMLKDAVTVVPSWFADTPLPAMVFTEPVDVATARMVLPPSIDT
jgi:hypothetical protein